MENSQKIKLFGSRDFAGNFDMTLTFLKQNYVKILKGTAILVPVLLILSYFSSNFNLLSLNSNYSSNILDTYATMFTFSALISTFFMYLIFYVLYLYIISYMAIYAKSPDGNVKNNEVWSKIADVFLPLLGGGIIFGILATIGFLFCIIPGIIIWVYLGFYSYVYINEERGVIDSFYRSHELVSNNWWITFGYGLVFLILMYIGQMIFTIPSFIIGIGIGLQIDFFASEIVVYIVTFIASLGYWVLFPIMYVAMGVMYYSHRNKLERVDMETEIDNLGTFSNEQNNQL